MNRPGFVLATAALLIAGCGSSGDNAVPDQASSVRSVPQAGAEALRQARDLKAATYDVVSTRRECTSSSTGEPCEVATMTFREHGSFTEAPDTWDGVMRIERPSSMPSTSLVTRLDIRQLPDGLLYMRDGVVSGGCWISLPKAARENSLLKLDAALRVLRNASVPHDEPSTGESLELDARAPAMDVLKVLGLFDGQTIDQLFPGGDTKEIQGVLVPITVLINADGSPRGFEVRGTQVSSVLNARHTDPPRPYALLPQSRDVTLELSNLGERKRPAEPEPDDIRPAEAPDGFRCE